jgi:2-polyprenyl-3-methyl-5-hydroxy-6-metoxy-1,4-benzoquinol methylase
MNKNEEAISSIDRIRINLLELKPREALDAVHRFYRKSMEKYFDEDGHPNGAYFEEVTCPICNGSEFKHRMNIDNFEYRECKTCRSIYNSPRLKGVVLDSMYKSGEYKTYFEKLTVPGQNLRKNVIDQRKFKQVSSLIGKHGTVLDVGCGTGSFLKVCRENGWEAYGVDPSESAVSVARERYDIEIEQNYFESYETEKKFDCITFWGQLEHLADPIKGLERAKCLLKSGGVIAFEVPSADSYLMKYLENNTFSPCRYIENARHVLFFSRISIDRICRTHNLKLSYIESNGLDLQTILLYEFDSEITTKLMAMQQTLDDLMLGDHYRVFLKLLK